MKPQNKRMSGIFKREKSPRPQGLPGMGNRMENPRAEYGRRALGIESPRPDMNIAIANRLGQSMGQPQAPQQGMFQGLMGALNKVPKPPVAPMQSEMNAAPEVPATEQTQDAVEPAPAAAQAQSEQPAPEQDNSAIDAQIAQLQQQIAQLQAQKK
jgi:hypothetical protein